MMTNLKAAETEMQKFITSIPTEDTYTVMLRPEITRSISTD